LPTASTALTEKVWEPSARPVSAFGEVHVANVPASSLHWKVDPASLDVNEKLGPCSADGFVGCDVIVVSGGPVSTIQVNVAGVGSALPAASVAFTENVCGPSSRPVSVVGDVQAANAPASSLHWKLDPVSLDVKE
jgi:hypothetical protein